MLADVQDGKSAQPFADRRAKLMAVEAKDTGLVFSELVKSGV